MYAMKGGKVYKMRDENDKDIERAIITNKNELADGKKWSHQTKPIEIKDKFDWKDGNIKPQNEETKMVNLADPEEFNKFKAVPNPPKKMNNSKVAPGKDGIKPMSRGSALDKIPESEKEHE